MIERFTEIILRKYSGSNEPGFKWEFFQETPVNKKLIIPCYNQDNLLRRYSQILEDSSYKVKLTIDDLVLKDLCDFTIESFNKKTKKYNSQHNEKTYFRKN